MKTPLPLLDPTSKRIRTVPRWVVIPAVAVSFLALGVSAAALAVALSDNDSGGYDGPTRTDANPYACPSNGYGP
jgi:hypothetical protein